MILSRISTRIRWNWSCKTFTETMSLHVALWGPRVPHPFAETAFLYLAFGGFTLELRPSFPSREEKAIPILGT